MLCLWFVNEHTSRLKFWQVLGLFLCKNGVVFAYIEMGHGHSSSVKLRYMTVLLSLHLYQVADFFGWGRLNY